MIAMARILFVAGQSAAGSFLAPLWRRWLATKDGAEFRVCLHASAAPAARELNGLPLLAAGETSDALENVLAGWRPDLIVTSLSSKPIERAAFDLARRSGIKVWQFVDTWYDYALRIVRTNGAGRHPDRLLVIDERAREEAIGEGLDGQTVMIVGNPAWEEVMPLPARDAAAILFVSQPIARHWGNSLGYTESTGWQMVRDAAGKRPDLFARLIFAPHPDEEIPRAVREAGIETVDSGRVGLAIAGQVLGLYSSIMVDAVLAGRNVISVQPNAGVADKCSLSRHGFIRRARDAAELIRIMGEHPLRGDDLRTAVAHSCSRLERALMASKQECVSSV
jgi:hypothetical protein